MSLCQQLLERQNLLILEHKKTNPIITQQAEHDKNTVLKWSVVQKEKSC